MVRALSAHQQTLKQVGPLAWDPGWKEAGVAMEAWSGVPGLSPELRSLKVCSPVMCSRECLCGLLFSGQKSLYVSEAGLHHEQVPL